LYRMWKRQRCSTESSRKRSKRRERVVLWTSKAGEHLNNQQSPKSQGLRSCQKVQNVLPACCSNRNISSYLADLGQSLRAMICLLPKKKRAARLAGDVKLFRRIHDNVGVNERERHLCYMHSHRSPALANRATSPQEPNRVGAGAASWPLPRLHSNFPTVFWLHLRREVWLKD
jgi:hypothetical protein